VSPEGVDEGQVLLTFDRDGVGQPVAGSGVIGERFGPVADLTTLGHAVGVGLHHAVFEGLDALAHGF
jgi:hypothetical protein